MYFIKVLRSKLYIVMLKKIQLISFHFISFDIGYYMVTCATLCINFSSKSKAIVLPKHVLKFFLTAQNLKLFGQKLQHFPNNEFQSYYDLFQVNWLKSMIVWLYHSMTETSRLKNVVIFWNQPKKFICNVIVKNYLSNV